MFEATFPPAEEEGSPASPPQSGVRLYKAARLYLRHLHKEGGAGKAGGGLERMERMLKAIVSSLDSPDPKMSYIGVFLVKEHSVAWIEHVKLLVATVSKVKLPLRSGNIQNLKSPTPGADPLEHRQSQLPA